MTISDKHLEFQRLMTSLQKSERERAEQCIADIIEDLCDLTQTPAETNEKITERIIKHYERR